MKWRIRKKAYDCAHHVCDTFLVTNDPYPMHETEDSCKLGRYNDYTDIFEQHPCDACTKFCASRPMIRKKREDNKRLKEYIKESNKYYNSVFKAGRWEEQDF